MGILLLYSSACGQFFVLGELLFGNTIEAPDTETPLLCLLRTVWGTVPSTRTDSADFYVETHRLRNVRSRKCQEWLEDRYIIRKQGREYQYRIRVLRPVLAASESDRAGCHKS